VRLTRQSVVVMKLRSPSVGERLRRQSGGIVKLKKLSDVKLRRQRGGAVKRQDAGQKKMIACRRDAEERQHPEAEEAKRRREAEEAERPRLDKEQLA
jgi:hypothetical protein